MPALLCGHGGKNSWRPHERPRPAWVVVPRSPITETTKTPILPKRGPRYSFHATPGRSSRSLTKKTLGGWQNSPPGSAVWCAGSARGEAETSPRRWGPWMPQLRSRRGTARGSEGGPSPGRVHLIQGVGPRYAHRQFVLFGRAPDRPRIGGQVFPFSPGFQTPTPFACVPRSSAATDRCSRRAAANTRAQIATEPVLAPSRFKKPELRIGPCSIPTNEEDVSPEAACRRQGGERHLRSLSPPRRSHRPKGPEVATPLPR